MHEYNNNKGIPEKRRRWNYDYTEFCDNLNFIDHLNTMYYFTIKIHFNDQTQY
jgi:hypothetical protein